jgi:hypothetical protein
MCQRGTITVRRALAVGFVSVCCALLKDMSVTGQARCPHAKASTVL